MERHITIKKVYFLGLMVKDPYKIFLGTDREAER